MAVANAEALRQRGLSVPTVIALYPVVSVGGGLLTGVFLPLARSMVCAAVVGFVVAVPLLLVLGIAGPPGEIVSSKGILSATITAVLLGPASGPDCGGQFTVSEAPRSGYAAWSRAARAGDELYECVDWWVHLYIHAPFCARRCSYCDFAIAVRKNVPVRQYVDCIHRELALVRAAEPGALPRGEPPSGAQLSTIYFGGGTPSLLPPEAIATILGDVAQAMPSLDAGEVTLEANPDDVTVERASAWRQAGVNRVSLGAQSFSDRALQWMHRTHDAARIGAAGKA